MIAVEENDKKTSSVRTYVYVITRSEEDTCHQKKYFEAS